MENVIIKWDRNKSQQTFFNNHAVLMDFTGAKCFEEFDAVNLICVAREFCNKQNSICSFTELLCKPELISCKVTLR